MGPFANAGILSSSNRYSGPCSLFPRVNLLIVIAACSGFRVMDVPRLRKAELSNGNWLIRLKDDMAELCVPYL